jgi:hypothetical protein
VDLSSPHYSFPKGKVGRCFINILASEFSGVQGQTWNSKRPLVFVAVVLQTTPGVKRARDIQKRLTHRMDLWYEGKFTALVDDTETEVQSRHSSHPVPDEEDIARAYNKKVLSGRLRPVVRNMTNYGTPTGQRLHKDLPAGPRRLAGQASADARPRSQPSGPRLGLLRALQGRPRTSPHQDHG